MWCLVATATLAASDDMQPITAQVPKTSGEAASGVSTLTAKKSFHRVLAAAWQSAKRRRRLIKARSWNDAGGATKWRKATSAAATNSKSIKAFKESGFLGHLRRFAVPSGSVRW